MKIKIDKKMALTALNVTLTVGSLVVGAIMKKDDNDEIAKKAADILEKRNQSKGNS